MKNFSSFLSGCRYVFVEMTLETAFSHGFSSANASAGVVLDLDTVLDRFGGDEELLKELASIFIDECPGLIADVRDAIAQKSAKNLERSAHSLKGAVANFCTTGPMEVARELEMMGRRSQMDFAQAALPELERQFQLLRPALASLLA